jgi:hypothetical protein
VLKWVGFRYKTLVYRERERERGTVSMGEREWGERYRRRWGRVSEKMKVVVS